MFKPLRGTVDVEKRLMKVILEPYGVETGWCKIFKGAFTDKIGTEVLVTGIGDTYQQYIVMGIVNSGVEKGDSAGGSNDEENDNDNSGGGENAEDNIFSYASPLKRIEVAHMDKSDKEIIDDILVNFLEEFLKWSLFPILSYPKELLLRSCPQ